MLNRFASTAVLLSLSALLVGCAGNPPVISEPPETLVWIEKGIDYEGVKISLGQRRKPGNTDAWVEPIAAITRNGESVADAMVFNRLVTAGDSQAINDEVAAVYEPSSGKEPALYARGKLKLPPETSQCVVRFRIVLPGSQDEWTRDIEIPSR